MAAFFACAKAGLILAPLSWRLAPAELAYQLEDAEPALFLVEEEHAALAEATGHPFEPLAPAGDGEPRDTAVADDDPLLLVYTSGTTGRPKGALLTHGNCFWTNLSFDLATGVSGDDVVLQVLPQFHCGGWNVQALLGWWKGARVVLERSFDPARCLALIEQKRVTTMMGVPANYLFLSQEPAFATADLSSLRRAVVGGAPMPEALLEVWHERGVDVVQGYGLTEAAPNVLCLPPEDAVRKIGWAGKPYPHVDARLAAEEELQVRGPNVFAGYWRNPEATAEVLVDGWLRTGDVAEIDADGFVTITDRKKDIIVTAGGKNVAPQNLENELKTRKEISQALVIGDKRPYVAALVTLDPEIAEGLTSEQKQARVQEIVDDVNRDRSRFEQIKRFVILPRDFSAEEGEVTPTLKLKRRVVAEHFANEIEQLYAAE